MSNWQETSQASLFNANLNKEKLKFLEMFPESVGGRNHPKMKGHHIPIHVHEMHTSSLDTGDTGPLVFNTNLQLSPVSTALSRRTPCYADVGNISPQLHISTSVILIRLPVLNI